MGFPEHAPAEATVRLIRLPQSAPRGVDTFHWLITGVNPRKFDQLAYETIRVSKKRDLVEGDLPPRFVLLEMAANVTRGRGHLQGPSRYTVWRWDRARQEWIELGRCLAYSWEWAMELRTVVEHALAEQQGPRVVDIVAGAARVMDAVDRELREIGQPERGPLLASVFEGVAVRLAAEG